MVKEEKCIGGLSSERGCFVFVIENSFKVRRACINYSLLMR